jgi:indolepyruvate ferredoxin oxidoreductase
MTTATLPIGREVRLNDRYDLDEGAMLLSGTQAMVRIIFDQMRADRRAGLNTGALVSGYPGSPIGGFDMELSRLRDLRAALNVVHKPGLNEDLGATAVWGSQLAPGLPTANVDGVLGVWYGKAPGLDRSGDALRHGSHIGAHPKGGMLALAGDDPGAKSSTLPSASETLLATFKMPVLVPGTPQEIVDLGLHAVALSRASGMWASLKIATNVADAVASVTIAPGRVQPVPVVVEEDGVPYVHVPSAEVAPPLSVNMERTLVGVRQRIALAYAAANGLDRVVFDSPGARLGIVAAGTTYYDLREALLTLGLDEDMLARIGVRILKLDMVWPLQPQVMKDFARGLDEILVVEEKDGFLERSIREVLYDVTERPRVIGKLDPEGETLLPAMGALDPDLIARAVAARVQGDGEIESVAARLRALDGPIPLPLLDAPVRTPFFCSGCPHNSSTEVPEGALVGAGIGCHAMVVISPEGKGEIIGVTHMGAEGVQWIGQAPFLDADHIFQNLGDGTFHHSGSLAVRAAKASGVNITYKLLYNSTVAMTGGQDVQGGMTVPDLTRWFEAEGIAKVVVTSDDPDKYKGVALSSIADVRPRAQLIAAQTELSKIPGVTVLIHDQGCAAEKRRLRKRGKMVDPTKRAFINSRVCEGCGDCGQKSHCLSVQPHDTEFGTKTQIHQSSCNKDYTCIEGDCPSFLMVEGGTKAAFGALEPPSDLPEPVPATVGDDVTLRLVGIGGTGVVTVGQVLGMAAVLDGKETTGLSQTGLAQKGGQVVSDVRFLPAGEAHTNRASNGTVDGYLAFDLLGATSPANLLTASPDRTVAIVSTSEIPTASMIGAPDERFVQIDRSLGKIEEVTRAKDNVYIDAQQLAQSLFGDHMPSNSIMIGAAWQRGLIPVSLKAMQEAYRLNGAAVETNLAAFQWGRAAVAAPELIARAAQPAAALPEPVVDPRAAGIAARAEAAAGSDLERLVEIRVNELIAYQSARYAESYADFVGKVARAERHAGTAGAVTEAVARNLYKLMAYKDEYEVARLHLDPVEQARIAAEFGEGAKVKYLLHPPALRAMGMDRKLELGKWFTPGFRALRRMRAVRGTKLDLFGYAEVRRVERELPGEYRGLVETALGRLDSDYETAAELCELPDVIRGYEDIKLRNVKKFRTQARRLERKLGETTAAAR